MSRRERPAGSEYGEMFAILPNGNQVPQSSFSGGFHGTRNFLPQEVFDNGFPPKGTDHRLLEHLHEATTKNSVFRGSTEKAVIGEQGAVYWATEDGWVYQIEDVPTWDTDRLLEGAVDKLGRYGGSPVRAELELTIPAKIATYRVVRAGKVVVARDGIHLMVDKASWQKNPNF